MRRTTTLDVLRRGLVIIEEDRAHRFGGCPGWLVDLGPHCVRCALADAKGEVDDELQSPWNYDDPLVDAVDAVRPFVGSRKVTKAEAIDAITRAMLGLR